MARREDGGAPANGGGAAAARGAGRGAPLGPQAPGPAVLSPPPGLHRSLHGSGGSPGSGGGQRGCRRRVGLVAALRPRAGPGGAPSAAPLSLRGKGRGCCWAARRGQGGCVVQRGLRGASSAPCCWGGREGG